MPKRQRKREPGDHELPKNVDQLKSSINKVSTHFKECADRLEMLEPVLEKLAGTDRDAMERKELFPLDSPMVFEKMTALRDVHEVLGLFYDSQTRAHVALEAVGDLAHEALSDLLLAHPSHATMGEGSPGAGGAKETEEAAA